MNSKTGALLQYLRDVEKGVLPKDHRILGKISSLLNRLPSMSESEFVDDLQAEINDVLLVSYLAALTRTTRTMSECVDKFNHAHPVGEKKNRRGLFGG